MKRLLAGLLVTLILGVCAPAKAALILYEPFDYGATSGSLNGKGGSATEIGFKATAKWNGGTYDPAGLKFGYLQVAGGMASNLTASLARQHDVTQEGTIYGSFLCKEVSGGEGDTAIAALMFTRAADTGDTGADLDVAFDEYGGSLIRKCGVRIQNTQGTAQSGSQAAAYGTTYLVLFSATGLVTSGNATQTLTIWVLTEEQFAYWRPNGLAVSSLNSATLGSDAGNVFGRATVTKSSGTARVQANDYIRFFIANGPNAQYDEIRVSNASLDEATPLSYTIVNDGIDLLSNNSASLQANLVSYLDDPPTVYCYWGLSDGGVDPDAWDHVDNLGTNGLGVVANPIAGLSSETKYFFRYFITNATGFAWAPATSDFTTLSGETKPMIGNIGFQNVQATSVDMVGNLWFGKLPVTVRCYWGDSDGGTDTNAWSHFREDSLTGYSYITNSITGLDAGKAYYFRYYAVNELGDNWAAATICASTLGEPRVVNDPGPTALGQTFGTLRGTLVGGNPDPEVRIYRGTTDGGTDPNAWNNGFVALGKPSFTTFDYKWIDLKANQTYWYRCWASNEYGVVWAPASTNFTTGLPVLTPAAASADEGKTGSTNNLIFTVTLSALSGQSVSVDYATADGTATVAGNDYLSASGTLVIPSGQISGQITVKIIGDDDVEANETITLILSNIVGATLAGSTATGTILNDDFVYFVRGDGQGSDANNGLTWATAFATLQKALNTVPTTSSARNLFTASPPRIVNVQASVAPQAYNVAARSVYQPLNVEFHGGWEDVDTTPAQSGMSMVQDMDGTIDKAGLSITGADHSGYRRIVMSSFVFTNVTRGVEIITASGRDGADIYLIASNCVVRSQADGLYVNYPKPYSYSNGSGYGGLGQIKSYNVDIVAGLGENGCAVFSDAHWGGSVISAVGNDLASGNPRVSSLSAPHGTGVFFRALNVDTPPPAVIEHTVIHGCLGPALDMSATRIGQNNIPGSNRVQCVIQYSTIADNAGNGLYMQSDKVGSYAAITNSIFANNGGYAINLTSNNFTCAEEYNVFFNNTLKVNNAAQTIDITSSVDDPLFIATGDKPAPWYALGGRASSGWGNASDGNSNRGAVQGSFAPRGTLILIQ